MDVPQSNIKGSGNRINMRQTEIQKCFGEKKDLEKTLGPTCPPKLADLGSNVSGAFTENNVEAALEDKAGFITSLKPLMIQFSPSQAPRPPTLQECEVIIRQLYGANSLQSQEILHVKALLKDIVSSKMISAENYILTKACFAGCKRSEKSETFPQLSFQTRPRRLIKSALRTKKAGKQRLVSQKREAEKVILPALKQNITTTVDRHKRTPAQQRRRLQRTTR